MICTYFIVNLRVLQEDLERRWSLVLLDHLWVRARRKFRLYRVVQEGLPRQGNLLHQSVLRHLEDRVVPAHRQGRVDPAVLSRSICRLVVQGDRVDPALRLHRLGLGYRVHLEVPAVLVHPAINIALNAYSNDF